MRRLSIALLITAVSIIAFTPIASAADLPRKAPVYAPPPPPPQDWSGIYVGLEGGYGWGHGGNGNNTVPFLLDPGPEHFDNFSEFSEFRDILNHNRSGADVLLGKAKQKGWLFGGFFGAQKQWGSWVLGIEGDVDAANIKGTVTGSSTVVDIRRPTDLAILGMRSDGEILALSNSATLASKIDMLGSLRGKVGFVPAPNWLIYGTGGAAFAHVKNSLTSDQKLFYGDDCSIGEFIRCEEGGEAANTFLASGGTSMFGWAAGAGVDWKLPVDAGSAWVFGVEYLHYGFGDQTVTLAGTNGGSFSFTGKENVDTVKGRISYLFAIH